MSIFVLLVSYIVLQRKSNDILTTKKLFDCLYKWCSYIFQLDVNASKVSVTSESSIISEVSTFPMNFTQTQKVTTQDISENNNFSKYSTAFRTYTFTDSSTTPPLPIFSKVSDSIPFIDITIQDKIEICPWEENQQEICEVLFFAKTLATLKNITKNGKQRKRERERVKITLFTLIWPQENLCS